MALDSQDREFISLSIKGVNARIEDMHENFNVKLEAIEKQTIRTNGRVTALESNTEKQSAFCGKVQAVKEDRESRKEKRQNRINLIFGAVALILTAVMIFFGNGIAKINTKEKSLDQFIMQKIDSNTVIYFRAGTNKINSIN